MPRTAKPEFTPQGGGWIIGCTGVSADELVGRRVVRVADSLKGACGVRQIGPTKVGGVREGTLKAYVRALRAQRKSRVEQRVQCMRGHDIKSRQGSGSVGAGVQAAVWKDLCCERPMITGG